MSDPREAFITACHRRLLDGAGDGAAFSGLIVDDFAGRWLVQTIAPDAKPPTWLREVSPPPASIYWKRLDAKDKEPARHWAGERIGAPFAVQENALRYRVDFQAGYSQGIFLDQRDNRFAVRQRSSAGATVLNCFAYTCAFSVAAAAGGAGTVSIDLSRRALDWGRENFALNGMKPVDGHEFLAGDVFDWLTRLRKHGRRFQGVVLDPPTFSRNREGRVFRVQDDFGSLVELALPVLAAGGWMLCTTNQRSLSADDFRRLIVASLPRSRQVAIHLKPMPPDFTGGQYMHTVWLVT